MVFEIAVTVRTSCAHWRREDGGIKPFDYCFRVANGSVNIGTIAGVLNNTGYVVAPQAERGNSSSVSKMTSVGSAIRYWRPDRGYKSESTRVSWSGANSYGVVESRLKNPRTRVFSD
jgi:hypothetical protein